MVISTLSGGRYGSVPKRRAHVCGSTRVVTKKIATELHLLYKRQTRCFSVDPRG
ncbi:MAG: hypothetical protein U0165_10945 [Polyangiaceae bacterium]